MPTRLFVASTLNVDVSTVTPPIMVADWNVGVFVLVQLEPLYASMSLATVVARPTSVSEESADAPMPILIA